MDDDSCVITSAEIVPVKNSTLQSSDIPEISCVQKQVDCVSLWVSMLCVLDVYSFSITRFIIFMFSLVTLNSLCIFLLVSISYF